MVAASIAAAACLLHGSLVLGCRIPVFRYALERWAPDPYIVEVVHREPLSEAQQALVARLKAAATDPVDPANVTVVERATGGPAGGAPEGDQQGDEGGDAGENRAPRLVLRAPHGPPELEVWAGPLTAESVDRLIESPARREVIDHLLAGDSAVWILIRSGDDEKDQHAEKLLREELQRMTQLLELPSREELEAEVEFRDDTPVELRIGFSLIVLKRDDAAEEVFLAQLLASEPDLKDFDEPIAIPIFGRGRTYYALVGKGIDRNNIEANCRFVCGDCSCQVKQQNPGVDLLLAADWESLVEGSALPYRELPVLTGIGGLELAAEVKGETDTAETAARPDPSVQPAAATRPAAEAAAAAKTTTAPAAASAGAPVAAPAAATGGTPSDAPAAASLPAADAAPFESELSFEHRLLLWGVLATALAAVCVAIGSLWLKAH